MKFDTCMICKAQENLKLKKEELNNVYYKLEHLCTKYKCSDLYSETLNLSIYYSKINMLHKYNCDKVNLNELKELDDRNFNLLCKLIPVANSNSELKEKLLIVLEYTYPDIILELNKRA